LALDCHAHWIPQPVARLLRERQRPPRIEGDTLFTWQGRRPAQPLLDVRERLALMERHGVALQVLSLAPLFGIDCLPSGESAPLVRAFNDATAELCRTYTQRFAGIAALPVADPARAVAEFERALGLGLRGATLPADAFATLAEAERWHPLFRAAQRAGGLLFVHPGPLVPQPERDVRAAGDDAWQRRIVLETQSRLSECVMTLACSGLLDAYPEVSVQMANLGGTIPFLLERMQAVAETRAEDLHARLRRCYVDTASFGPRAIELAVHAFGADRVVLGTDCPIFSTERMLQAAVALPGDARHAILEANPRRLLKLQTP
jgi:predicted TIM-barrel fold metal-dependent hydrolase